MRVKKRGKDGKRGRAKGKRGGEGNLPTGEGGEGLAAEEVVVEDDVAALERFAEEIAAGMGGVGAAHAAEVAVGFEDGAGVGEIKGSYEFRPGKGVEQTAAQERRA